MGVIRDLAGQRFGRLFVTELAHNKNKKGVIWKCVCDCGIEKEVASKDLLKGNTNSCGCLRRENSKIKFKDITGRRFGRLLVLGPTELRNHGYMVWKCKCDCGEIHYAIISNLLRGTSSCGCYRREFVTEFKKLPVIEANFNEVYYDYKHAAELRKYCFELTKEQFKEITSSNCHYCGVEPKQIRNGRGRTKFVNGFYYHNGIDRVDNSLGYTVENSVPCCTKCNFAKKTMTLDDFKDWVYRVYNHIFCDRNIEQDFSI